MGRQDHWARLMNLGIPSLLSLFFGGTILLFTGINCFVRPSEAVDTGAPEWWYKVSVGPSSVRQFNVGARLGVQAWLAIIGVGFGLVSYGVSEAYHHGFDWWCSRKALGTTGLDYARYLNSQPRSPVAYGVRGFVQFATLRYLTAVMAIVASVGYKFGVVRLDVVVDEYFGGRDEYGRPPNCLIEQLAPNALSLLKSQSQGRNPRFYHERLDTPELYEPFRDDSMIPHYKYGSKPPASVVMLGQLWCMSNHLPDNFDYGVLSMVEPVVIANLTEEVGNFSVSKDAGDWQRSKSWIDLERPTRDGDPPKGPQTPDLVVDYRIKGSEKLKLEIQWATAGPWLEDPQSQETQPVHYRLTYELHLATAEVRRRVSSAQLSAREVTRNYDPSKEPMITYINFGDSFGPVDHEMEGTGSVRVLSTSKKPVPWHNVTTESLPHQWIDVGLREANMLPLDCVSVILHFAMAEWRLRNLWTIKGTLEENEYFNMPQILNSMQHIASTRRPLDEYPFYVGTATDGSGCYETAAIVFIVLGVFAILLGVLRIVVGPPRLTSWIAQHISLCQSGAISITDLEAFDSGYKVVPRRAGVLRLGNDKDCKAMLRLEKGKDIEKSPLQDGKESSLERSVDVRGSLD